MPKIKNVEGTVIDGIAFKSRFEGNTYIMLKAAFGKENVAYEKDTFTLIDTFIPSGRFWFPGKGKDRSLKLKKGKVRKTEYTIDFTVTHNGKTFYVESKGMTQEVYAIKRKMLMEKFGIHFFEVHNKKQILEAISIIKETI